MNEHEVRAALRHAIEAVDGRAYVWAEKHGFSAAYVSFILNGKQRPSRRMCDVLGFRREVVYLRSSEARP